MKFKTQAENRKDIVAAMEQILEEKSQYQGPPSFSYKIGNFTLDRNGIIECESEEEGKKMQHELTLRGFAKEATDALTIEIPMEGHTIKSIKNLIYMIHSKQYLLEKSIGTKVLHVSDRLVERLGIEVLDTIEEVLKVIEEEQVLGLKFEENKIVFTNFPIIEEKATAFCELVAMMSKVAKENERVNSRETIEENEKYYMRVWLVRLGLGGANSKHTRKILLENLKGHTAFRTEVDREKWRAKNRKKVQEEQDEVVE